MNSSSAKEASGGGDTTMPISKNIPKARQKQGVRKGFGLSDWYRLVKSSKNLSLNSAGVLRKIKPSEIRKHSTIHDGWISLHKKVYNISPYLAYHPGGVDIMKPVLGRDASALFDKYHRWVNVDGLIGVLHIGYLEKEDIVDEDDEKMSYLPAQHTVDGFAVPAPRPPKAAIKPMLSPSLGRDEDDDEQDIDPLGK